MADNATDDLAAGRAMALGANRLVRARHGLFVFPARDAKIGRALELYGEFAEGECKLLSRLVNPGDTAVDVGANLGTITVPLARRAGPKGRIYAFEPQRRVFQCLCANLALNGIENVHAMQLGLGSAEAVAHVALPADAKGNLGTARLVQSGGGEEARVVTLDSLKLESCALIKIDVEGMEPAVLLGAKGTVERHRPALYIEAKKGPGTERVIQWLQERQYDLHWHFAGFVGADNFRGRPGDVFSEEAGGTGWQGDINILALPAERKTTLILPRVAGPKADWIADYAAWQKEQRAKKAGG